MPAARHKLTIEQGASFSRVVRWTRAAEGSPINLSGYTAEMQIRPRANSPKPLVTLRSPAAFGIDLSRAAAGELVIRLSPEQTQALPPATHVYDLVVVSPTEDVYKLLSGSVQVLEGVTR